MRSVCDMNDRTRMIRVESSLQILCEFSVNSLLSNSSHLFYGTLPSRNDYRVETCSTRSAGCLVSQCLFQILIFPLAQTLAFLILQHHFASERRSGRQILSRIRSDAAQYDHHNRINFWTEVLPIN